MSTEEVSNAQPAAGTPAGCGADITQQVTTPTPANGQTKNPKLVAAGKAVAERTRIAREAQKRALAEANVIIKKKPSRQSSGQTQQSC